MYPPQVPVSCHHPYPEPPEVLLCLGYVPRGHDQDALGRLQVVAMGRSPCLMVPEVLQYLMERPSRPRIISVPWLSDPGVDVPKFPDKGEEPYAIRNHGEGVPLGHSLLAMQ